MTWQHRSMVAVLALVAACGGSGSTGLISPENAVLDEVRRDGTCVTSDAMVTYCATDAVSPTGASASGPLAGPAPTATPNAAGPTPSPGSVPTPAASPTAAATFGPTAQPTPCGAACPGGTVLEFVVHGLPEGAACALAARPAGSDGGWSTGNLAAAGGATMTIAPALPSDVGSGDVEIALLCFDERPDALPASITTLSETDPDVVFVPAQPVTVSATSQRSVATGD